MYDYKIIRSNGMKLYEVINSYGEEGYKVVSSHYNFHHREDVVIMEKEINLEEVIPVTIEPVGTAKGTRRVIDGR